MQDSGLKEELQGIRPLVLISEEINVAENRQFILPMVVFCWRWLNTSCMGRPFVALYHLHGSTVTSIRDATFLFPSRCNCQHKSVEQTWSCITHVNCKNVRTCLTLTRLWWYSSLAAGNSLGSLPLLILQCPQQGLSTYQLYG